MAVVVKTLSVSVSSHGAQALGGIQAEHHGAGGVQRANEVGSALLSRLSVAPPCSARRPW
jgi:hypothetical protein